MLKHGDKRIEATVIHDYSLDDPPYPAVRIYKTGRGKEEYLVGRSELLSKKEYEQEQEAEEKAILEEFRVAYADIIGAFEAGNISVMAIAKHLKKQHCEVLSRCRKAERLGFIKLVKGER